MINLFSKLKEKKILLIDDDEWIRNSMSLFFETEGCQLHALETAEEAIEALKQEHYDIIITDYRLPGMDGLQFLNKINILCPDALKMLITAYRSPEVVSAAIKAGIHDFIEKPFTSETIEDSLSRLIAVHETK